MAKSFPSSLGLVLPCYPVSSGASSLASPLLASWRSTLLHVPPSALLKNRTHFTKGGCSLCSPYTPAYSFLPFPEFWEKMSPAICLPHKWLCLTHSTAGMFARMRQTGRISSLLFSQTLSKGRNIFIFNQLWAKHIASVTAVENHCSHGLTSWKSS